MSVQCLHPEGTELEAFLIKYPLCFHLYLKRGIPHTCWNRYLVHSSPCELQDTKLDEWIYGVRREFKDLLFQFCHLLNGPDP